MPAAGPQPRWNSRRVEHARHQEQHEDDTEDELDEIEAGNEKWTDLLGGFYGHLTDEIKVAEKKMEDIKRMEHPTEELCEKCGSPLVLKWGKFGSFYSCSNFTKTKPKTIAVSVEASSDRSYRASSLPSAVFTTRM